jgi:hypothetical protein
MLPPRCGERSIASQVYHYHPMHSLRLPAHSLRSCAFPAIPAHSLRSLRISRGPEIIASSRNHRKPTGNSSHMVSQSSHS